MSQGVIHEPPGSSRPLPFHRNPGVLPVKTRLPSLQLPEDGPPAWQLWRRRRRWPHLQPRASVQRRQQRVHLPPEAPREREDVRLGLGVVERHLALLVVQIDAQVSRRHRQGQRGRLGLGAGVELLRAPPQRPVAAARRHGDAPAAFGVDGGHAHPPDAGVGDVHLPVVAPAAVALPPRDPRPAGEALRAVGEVRGLGGTLLDPPLVLGDLEPRVVGHGVQGDVGWGGAGGVNRLKTAFGEVIRSKVIKAAAFMTFDLINIFI